MKMTVKERQTLLDVALIEYGSLETVMELAAANGVALTDELEDGQVLTIPATVDRDTRTVALYSVQRIKPATGLSGADLAACGCSGIGFMGIEVDFEVS